MRKEAEVLKMLLVDSLLLLSTTDLADIYDTLYQPSEPEAELTDVLYRDAIAAYWSQPLHWNELIVALSVPERQALTRMALHEKYPIDVFLEQLAGLGLVVLEREKNSFLMPDDVRSQLLERLPSLHDRIAAVEEENEDGSAPV